MSTPAFMFLFWSKIIQQEIGVRFGYNTDRKGKGKQATIVKIGLVCNFQLFSQETLEDFIGVEAARVRHWGDTAEEIRKRITEESTEYGKQNGGTFEITTELNNRVNFSVYEIVVFQDLIH